MKVAVYYNLHKHTFSLQSRNKEDYGRVIDHIDHVILKNVKFTVREAGRQKVLNEKKKNVHSFAVGELVSRVGLDRGPVVEVTYNPYKYSTFVVKDTEEPIEQAEYAVLRIGINNNPIIGAY